MLVQLQVLVHVEDYVLGWGVEDALEVEELLLEVEELGVVVGGEVRGELLLGVGWGGWGWWWW